jgi:hypothetical protein
MQAANIHGSGRWADPGRRYQQCDSSNQVTIRPPRRRQPHRAASRNELKPSAVFRKRVPGTEYLRDECSGDPRPLRPPGKRHALPDRHPGHHRTRPSPAGRPRKPAGQRADAGKCTLTSAANVKPAGRPPRTPVRGPSVVAAPVRGRPCKADGPVHRSLAPIPVRYASVGIGLGPRTVAENPRTGAVGTVTPTARLALCL